MNHRATEGYDDPESKQWCIAEVTYIAKRSNGGTPGHHRPSVVANHLKKLCNMSLMILHEDQIDTLER